MAFGIGFINKFKTQIGPKCWNYLRASIVIGAFLFLIESSMVFAFQSFLAALGVLDKSIQIDYRYLPHSLVGSILALIAFGGLRAAVYGARAFFANLTQHSFMHFHRGKLLRLALENTAKVSTKEVISLFSEVVTSSGVMVNYLSTLTMGLVSGLLYGLFALYLAPVETLIGVLTVAIFLIPLRKITKQISSHGDALVQEWESVNESLINGIRNNFFLKVYNLIETEVQKGQLSLDKYRNHVKVFSVTASIVAMFPSFIGLVVLCGLSYLSVTVLGTSPAKLLVFFYIFIKLVQSLSEVNQTFASCRLNWPGFKHLIDWEDRVAGFQKPKAIQDGKSALMPRISNIDVAIDEFSYGDTPVLGQQHFRLAPGDILVIKGPSGVGKSTLLSLLLGINDASKGFVKTAGVPVSTAFPVNSDKLAYVGPEPFLIKGTIRENLLYGSSGQYADHELYNALKKVGLAEFVEALALGLEQPLLEVAELSTGQKQRLSFARAILRKYDFLVLDEATSNLDLETEKRIIQTLKAENKDKIVVIVTHRSSFDEIGTRVLKMSEDNAGTETLGAQ